MVFFDKVIGGNKHEQAFDELYDSMKAARQKQPTAGDLLGSAYIGYSQNGYLGTGLSYYALVSAYKSWVYTCTTKNANCVAMLPLRLIVYRNSTGRKIAGTEIKSAFRVMKTKHDKRRWLKSNGLQAEEVLEHPFLELMKRPNKVDTRFILWFNIMLRLELSGTCGVYIASDGLGVPREMWALPLTKSGVLKPIPDAKELIGGYVYEETGKITRFTPDEILFLRYPDPSSPFEGMSPLKAQLYPYDIDTFLEKQQYYLLKNRAVFGNVLGTDQNLKQAQIDELKATLLSQYQGAVNTGNPLVLHSGLKLQEHKLGATLADLMVSEVEQFAQDKLLSAYGTPAGKLGMVKDVNRANMEALDETYYQDTIRPKTMMIEEMFEAFVLPRYDSALTMDFDLPERDERETDLKERETNLRMKYTTINEEREKEGKDPVAWGDAPWGSFTEVQLGAARPAPENTDVGGRGGDKPADDSDGDDSDDDDEQDDTGGAAGKKSYRTKTGLTKEFWTKERKAAAWKSYVASHSNWESMLQSVMRGYFADQKERVKDYLLSAHSGIHSTLVPYSKAKARQVLARMCEKKSIDELIGLDKKAEAKRLAEVVTPIVKHIIDLAGQQRLDFLSGNLKSVSGKSSDGSATKAADLGFEFNVNDKRVLKWLGTRMEEFSEEVTGTSFDEIKAILREGFSEGKPAATIAQDLDERFESWDKYRALEIARTETTGSSNYADVTAVEQAGLADQLKKAWLTAGDGNERETHAAAGKNYEDGIEIDQYFSVGTDEMPAPGNGSVAGENINCRCSLYYIEK